MKFTNITKIILVFAVALITLQEAQAQQRIAYGYSDIVYDKTTKKVTTLSRTHLNYYAGLHYDPAVRGNVYKDRLYQGSSVRRTGIADFYDAIVKLTSRDQVPPNTRYDIISDHYIAAYFYTTVVILDDDGGPTPFTQRLWYDPAGFSALGDAQEPGWADYKGSDTRETFYEVEYFRLGSTGKGVITDPPPCPNSGNMALSDGSCTDDLTVEIRNKFKANQDLSGKQQRALLGAPVQLTSAVSSSSSETKTFKWKVNSRVESTAPNFDTYFDKIGSNTVTLEVQQGSRPVVSKSFPIDVTLPELKEDRPQNIIGGFSGVERLPFITTNNVLCGHTFAPILILGCPKEIPVKDRSSINTLGVFQQALVAPPDDFISNGDQSHIEFLQIINPSITKHGTDARGKAYSECLKFTTTDTNGWRKDFSGQDYPNGEVGGFKVSSTFKNGKTGIDARVKLDFVDSPFVGLSDRGSNNEVINTTVLDEQFETYVSYYADSINDPNDPNPKPQGKEFRYALAVIPWKWKATAKRTGSTWKLFGGVPSSVTDLRNSQIAFNPNSTGERAFSGLFKDVNPLDAFKPCSSNLPVTTTTRKNVAVWRKNNGVWYVLSADGGSMTDAQQWGVDYDIPVPGDYDGDGLADFAVWRPDNPATAEDECANGCQWFIHRSSDALMETRRFGSRTDQPVPADYDGDGRADIAVFRPIEGNWYIFKSSDASVRITQFGSNGEVAVPSDYDGDGIDDVAVWSPNSATWKILNSSNQTVTNQVWGTSADKPVIGDYDGDGKTDIANWQPSGNWHILYSSSGQTVDTNFGMPTTDTPIPGDYDGDGKTDIAVWRPSGGTQAAVWYILNSSNGQVQYQYWGSDGDIPVPAAYHR